MVNRDPLFGKVLGMGRTLRMDHVRRCPQQIFDPRHYSADGPCLCRRGRAAGVDDRLDAPETRHSGRVPISVQMRPNYRW